MVRLAKNMFAPINQLSPEILSIIPEYCGTDKELIELTHVCHGWREIFISHASLWAVLDCRKLSKTHTYLNRSKGSPLEICLEAPFLNAALLLTIPHIGRLRALTFSGSPHQLLKLTEHFGYPAPLLRKLDLFVRGTSTAPIRVLFNGELPSLHDLHLASVVTDLPWESLSNLTTLNLYKVPNNITQFLNLFEQAPLLCEVVLTDSLPDISDASAELVVSLPNLELLDITTEPAPSVLLNHLHIPAGAMVSLGFKFSGETSPILDSLPKSFDNFSNLSHITSIHFELRQTIAMGFKGPNGGLYMVGSLIEGDPISSTLDHQIHLSLDRFHLSTVEKLMITNYTDSDSLESTSQALLLMSNLHTLTLVNSANLSFISALNPNYNSLNTVACPRLEGLILWIRALEEFHIKDLLEMAEQRASKGAKLSMVVINCEHELVPAGDVLDLRRYVSHVEYKLEDWFPTWDVVPSRIHELDDDNDW